MASSTRKKTTKKNTASTRTKSNSKSKRTSAAKSRSKAAVAASKEAKRISMEIRLCLVLAISVLLLLANFGLIGRFGIVMSNALFGAFGLMAYLFPFMLFFGYAFFVANRHNPLIFRKVLGCILMFLFLASFMQLLTLGVDKNAPFSEFYRISAEEHTGGGYTGGVIAWAFNWVFGIIGSYVLTICGITVSSIIMTQRPLLSQLGAGSRNAARKAREKQRERRDERMRLREEGMREWEAEEEARAKRREQLHKEEMKLQAKAEKERKAQEKAARSEAKSRKKAEAVFVPAPEPVRRGTSPLDMVTLERPERTGRPVPIREPITAQNDLPGDNGIAFDPALPFEETGEIAAPKKRKDEGISFNMPTFLQNEPKQEESTNFFAEEEMFAEDSRALFEDEPSVTPEEVHQIASEPVRRETPAASQASEHETAQAEEEPSRATRKKKVDPGAEDVSSIEAQIDEAKIEEKEFEIPPVTLLTKGQASKGDSEHTLMATAQKLQQTLQNFGVNVRMQGVSRGPTVTRYELQPEQGVKVSRILNLQDDIKLNLAAAEIRIEAPIPGKAAIGIEVPNKETSPVLLRDICETPDFLQSKANLAFAVGKDIGGHAVVTDIEKMPHLLIAGATGSGKSVCINTLIMSILLKCKPDEVKMLMIDPKVVELKIYDGIPHLLIPVVTDAKKAAGALNWAVQEMTDRYNKFAQYPGVRDIKSYNERITKMNKELDRAEQMAKMPRIVIIVDELADLMMVASSEVEDAICRLAQLARAAGIHLIIATQRPSVNVVTGLIKANMPSRIALSVTSGTDSRTILDMNGAEKLLGHGDMLFYPQGYPKPARVQGAYISDSDITEVVKFLTSQADDTEYNREVTEHIESSIASSATGGSQGQSGGGDDRDEFFAESGRLIIEKEKASIGMLQRAFKIGFNRAARIMDQLAEAGVVGGEEGTKPRKILMSMAEFDDMLSNL